MIYYKDSNFTQPHYMFIGRWCPLHKGHTAIIEKMLEKQLRPILLLVRDTKDDKISSTDRALLLRKWVEYRKHESTIMIIPDIHGIYYGRGVGYEVQEIDNDPEIKAISGNVIREKLRNRDDSWKSVVAEGTEEMIERLYKEVR